MSSPSRYQAQSSSSFLIRLRSLQQRHILWDPRLNRTRLQARLPEVPGMNEILMLMFGAMVILGTLATVISRDLFDKLISLGIIVAGIMPFLADRGLLDVLTATALIAPLSTLFILMAVRRKAD